MIVRKLNMEGDMLFGQGLSNFAKDSEAVAQNVRTRLLLVLSEWFLNTEDGTPYLENIFIKPAQLSLVEATLKARIVETEDVAELNEFELLFDSAERTATISAKVRTIYGDIANIRIVQ